MSTRRARGPTCRAREATVTLTYCGPAKPGRATDVVPASPTPAVRQTFPMCTTGPSGRELTHCMSSSGGTKAAGAGTSVAMRHTRPSYSEQVIPRLSVLGTEVAGDGVRVTVRFSKTKGAPVRLVGADEDVEASAVREVDLQQRFHWSPRDLATKLKLTGPRALALRRYLKIDDDPACRHTFVFGSRNTSGTPTTPSLGCAMLSREST